MQSKTSLDIVFAFGAADPSGQEIFELEKKLAMFLIDQQKNTIPQYSVIKYADTASTVIPLQKFQDLYRLKDQLQEISWPGNGRAIRDALRQASWVYKGSKPSARKVLILFMSGQQTASLPDLRQAARLLTDQGVRVVVVGYGDQRDTGVMTAITKNTDNTVVIGKRQNDDDLDRILRRVFKGNFFSLVLSIFPLKVFSEYLTLNLLSW